MNRNTNRREFLQQMGCTAALLPFLGNLPSLGFAATAARKQRVIFMFSPNGVVPKTFWPDAEGKDFVLKDSLKPLEPYKSRSLFLHGVCNKIKGDGDGHMRGMGCLLTGIELFPGNIQGGSDTPAGWAKGLSIDQEIGNYLQNKAATKTRFSTLEFGVNVTIRADTWTRWSYAGANQPLSPISNPYQMFNKLYGQMKDQKTMTTVLDQVKTDLKKLSANISVEDRRLLEQHTTFVNDAEKEYKAASQVKLAVPMPTFADGVKVNDDDMPRTSRMQIDLMINSFQNDFTRVATLQYTNSVGNAKMKWLGVTEGHHTLSHEPDEKQDVQDQLTKINTRYCEELAYLVKRLSETKEPGTNKSLLDNTTVVWTNELGKGNSHTRDDIPFVLVGDGLDFKMGRSLKYKKEPHNRLLMSFAHAFGHQVKTFGNPEQSANGVLQNLT